jgi:hypothetical protein
MGKGERMFAWRTPIRSFEADSQVSALAGLIYARLIGGGFGDAAVGGAIAGAVCAIIGIAASVALGDTAATILMFGTTGSAVTGAIGGLLGRAIPHTASA